MAGQEPVEGVVIEKDAYPRVESDVLSWADAEPLLLDRFDDGFGGVNCYAITAWTASWVIAVSQYDGSTSPFRLPRNPIAHIPSMPGG